MNQKALEFLNHYLNKNEDYQLVTLDENQLNEVKTRCEKIQLTNEDELYDEVEVTLNGYLFELGYKWNEETYKYFR